MIKGNRLKELRERRGLTAQELAKELGIGVAQVFRYEAEKTDAASDTVAKMALFFKVSTDYLLGLARDPEPPDPAPYLEYEWPPKTTTEALLVDFYRKHKYVEAVEIILESYHEWRSSFPPDLDDILD